MEASTRLERDPVARAWRRAASRAEALDLAVDPHETPQEFAARVHEQLGAPGLVELAELETARRWGPVPLGPAEADRAATLLAAVERELDGHRISQTATPTGA